MNTKKDLEDFSKTKGMNSSVDLHFYNWEYMIEFADKQTAKVKNLDLQNVSDRRELLIAYELRHWKNPTKEIQQYAERMVDNFESNL